MTAFAPIALPATALSRTWFADLLMNDGLPYAFRSILRTLTPDVYAALSDKSAIECYKALLGWLAEDRLPLEVFATDAIDDFGHGGEWNDGMFWEPSIPCEVFGVSYEEPEQNSAAKELLIYEHAKRTFEYSIVHFPSLARYWEDIAKYDDDPQGYPTKPPRGRRWIEPWNGLPDLCAWMTSNTGIACLDYSWDDIHTGGTEMPPWTVADIQSLVKLWQEAKAIMLRADALAAFIDERPIERLSLLRGLIRHNHKAIREITRPTTRVTERALIKVLA